MFLMINAISRGLIDIRMCYTLTEDPIGNGLRFALIIINSCDAITGYLFAKVNER